MKSQQCIDQRGLAGSVRTQQTDGAPIERATQSVENSSAAELNVQIVEFDRCCHLSYLYVCG